METIFVDKTDISSIHLLAACRLLLKPDFVANNLNAPRFLSLSLSFFRFYS